MYNPQIVLSVKDLGEEFLDRSVCLTVLQLPSLTGWIYLSLRVNRTFLAFEITLHK